MVEIFGKPQTYRNPGVGHLTLGPLKVAREFWGRNWGRSAVPHRGCACPRASFRAFVAS